MRFGVEVLPPFVLASLRFMIAGPILLGLCAIFRVRMMPSKRELVLLAIIGILMLGSVIQASSGASSTSRADSHLFWQPRFHFMPR